MILRSVPIVGLMLVVLLQQYDVVIVDSFTVTSKTITKRGSPTSLHIKKARTHYPRSASSGSNANANKPVLVCTSAASLEGTAFCRQVLKRGKFRVRALVHDVDCPRSKVLKDMGAELFVADNNDVRRLRRAFDGAHGVYGVTTSTEAADAHGRSIARHFHWDPKELENAETLQGQNIIEAALGTGREYDNKNKKDPTVKHFILQSMHRGGRKRDAAFPNHHAGPPSNFKAKWRQEDALLTRMAKSANDDDENTRWSILRQPTLLSGFDSRSGGARRSDVISLRPGVVEGLLDKYTLLTVIAVEDLGALASRMFEEDHALAYGNGGILVAGSERVTGEKLAHLAKQVCNDDRMDFEYRSNARLTFDSLMSVEHGKQLKSWLAHGGNDEGFRLPRKCYNHGASAEFKNHLGDQNFLKECRQIYPGTLSVKDWFVSCGVDRMTTPPSVVDHFVESIGKRATQFVTLLETP